MKKNPRKGEISSELLSILVCPACKGSVILQKGVIKCKVCKKVYKIKDNTPIMMQKAA